MSEIALYRKYRPKDFAEVLGQDHVIDVLEGALERRAVAHAYLFAGSRGTGKTSVARILAGKIGCKPMDIHEIDAASNRGIDDIRELRAAVQTLPFESPYKVYIIDEAHMLTKEAFNALLKTLEEPPAHAVFILATTEARKLPDTIVSRCQTFTFKKPSQAVLRDAVIKIAEREGFVLEPSSGDLIALLGDGSFRDAQGILQKVLSASPDKKISPAEVERVTGAPARDLVNSFIAALAESDIEKGMGAVQKALEQNVDMSVFLKLILRNLRFILLLRFAKRQEEAIREHVTKEDFDFLSAMVSSSRITSHTLKTFLSAHDTMRYAHVPELSLELALMEVMGHNA